MRPTSRRKKSAKYWFSGDDAPVNELRQTQADESRPHGGAQRYKDKKNWCRGKIGGRRHTGEVRFGQHWNFQDERARCFWSQYNVNTRRWYHCEHVEICSNDMCRKVLDWSLGEKRCPDRDTAPFYDPAWYEERRRQLLEARRKKS